MPTMIRRDDERFRIRGPNLEQAEAEASLTTHLYVLGVTDTPEHLDAYLIQQDEVDGVFFNEWVTSQYFVRPRVAWNPASLPAVDEWVIVRQESAARRYYGNHPARVESQALGESLDASQLRIRCLGESLWVDADEVRRPEEGEMPLVRQYQRHEEACRIDSTICPGDRVRVITRRFSQHVIPYGRIATVVSRASGYGFPAGSIQVTWNDSRHLLYYGEYEIRSSDV